MMKNSVILETFEEKYISEHINLGASVYSSQEVLSKDHLNWKHLQSPYGKSISVNLRNKLGLLVGRSFIQPRIFCVNSLISYSGGMVTDLLIKPDARNADALIAIIRAVKSPKQIEIILHTSNEASEQIYQKLFKFPIAFKLRASGLPIYFAKILQPYLKIPFFQVNIDPFFIIWRFALIVCFYMFTFFRKTKLMLEPSQADLLKIFQEFKSIAGSHFDRSPSFLKWRFTEGSLFNGRTRWIGFGNECTGYIVFKDANINGLKICLIMDVAMRRNLTWLEGVSLKFLCINIALKNSCDAIFNLSNTGNPALGWLRGFPFFNIPDSVLPHSTPIFIHASEKIFPIKDRKNTYITLADLDYF